MKIIEDIFDMAYVLWELLVNKVAPRLEAPVVLALYVAVILAICVSYGALAYRSTFGA